jgi:hypothetical protein
VAETVRIQPPDGEWDTVSSLLGSDPAAVNLVWDEHGPLTASFSLPGVRPKRALHQLTSYTPIEIVAGDDPVWGGRLVETPVARSGLTVSAEGRQAELDDHAEPIFYKHTRLADYQDESGFPRAYLYQAGAGYSAGGVVSAGDTGIAFGWSAGSTVKPAPASASTSISALPLPASRTAPSTTPCPPASARASNFLSARATPAPTGYSATRAAGISTSPPIRRPARFSTSAARPTHPNATCTCSSTTDPAAILSPVAMP